MQQFTSWPIFNGLRQYSIGIVDVINHNILVTMTWLNGEAPGLIWLVFSRHVGHGNKDLVCFHVARFLHWIIIHHCWLGTLLLLIEMALGGCRFSAKDIFCGMLSHKVRAPLEVTLFNGLEQCWFVQWEKRCMTKFHQLLDVVTVINIVWWCLYVMLVEFTEACGRYLWWYCFICEWHKPQSQLWTPPPLADYLSIWFNVHFMLLKDDCASSVTQFTDCKQYVLQIFKKKSSLCYWWEFSQTEAHCCFCVHVFSTWHCEAKI